MMKAKCCICGGNSFAETDPMSVYTRFECEACGRFLINLDKYNIDKNFLSSFLYYKYKIPSQITNEKHLCFLGSEEKFKEIQKRYPRISLVTNQEAKAWYPQTFDKKINTILLGFSKLSKYDGSSIEMTYEQYCSVLFVKRYNYDDSETTKKERDKQIKFIENYLFENNFVSTFFVKENNFNSAFFARIYPNYQVMVIKNYLLELQGINNFERIRITLLPDGLKRIDELKGTLRKAVLIRHDLVHGNGKTKEGTDVDINSDAINSLISKKESFISNIDKRIKQTNVSGEVFTDSRDGKKYRIVKIDTQTWMAENLAFKCEGSKCYDNDLANTKKYGRLYDWETANKAVPPGWHLPSLAEWNVLIAAVGGEEAAGKKLKAKSGWNNFQGKSGNGTDEFGFSALPGGGGGSDGRFYSVGYLGYWWSASEDSSGNAYYRGMTYNDEDTYLYDYDKSHLFSVRCLQD